jgi:methylthioribose-1-phosphate isomerase
MGMFATRSALILRRSLPVPAIYEERDESEVLSIGGLDAAGDYGEVKLAASHSKAFNPAFDVTPADLVAALITEHGNFDASEKGLQQLGAIASDA